MKKAIAYLRVSTKEQSDRGYSLPTQEQDIRAYADRTGFEIVGVFSEDKSGLILDRPELTKVREALRRKEATVLIAHDSDRISRSPEHYVILRSEWENLGISLHYAQRGEIRLGEFGPDIIEDFQGRFARQWLKKLVEATSRGKRGKIIDGKVIVAQRPPYGYKVQDGQLIIIEAQAEIVRLIFYLYAHDGYSLQKIADHLSKRQVPTPADTNERIFKRRDYGVWTKNTIRNILSRETYIGVWYWGKTQRSCEIIDGKKQVKITPTPKEQWIPVEVPAIVTRLDFDMAQARLFQARQMSSRNTKRQYLMAKRLVCSCGQTCYAASKTIDGKLFSYYFCSSHERQTSNLPCNNPYFRADIIDDGGWQYIKNLLADPDRMIELIEANLAQAELDAPNLENELRHKQDQLASKHTALERLTRKWMYSDDDEAVFDKIRGETLAEIEQLKSDISQLELKLSGGPAREHLLTLAKAIREYETILLRDDEPFEVKQAWIEAFDLHAILWTDGKDRKVTYSWYLEEYALSVGAILPRKYSHIWQIQETLTLNQLHYPHSKPA